ncbi:RabGAP/TBC domain-containing protein [Heterostelium album PN500]|uniref:RabGAP/TBC domain-containing protein n=1 Tax=Heterostelium pallidum (strain ATCC 26659 / Pp 5 / PN500) TaxID=670386 RepID=D3B5H1_HETP5|nr:RabGAP/TBC domain-containing protein [Heterostelium album PN500]EFA83119.1 RabGAP/TBC domain-containing protein [Heterostelium album PN500]|eukprot:XP_020435236.1 RabGAP/TBC domain-containing protein [Heterostelium album PN500]
MFSDIDRKKANKVRTITSILQKTPVDALRKCAVTEFGFVNNIQRSAVWPILIDVDKQDEKRYHRNMDREHRDIDQVAKDVDRSMWRFTRGKSKLRNTKREELTRIINAILASHPQLHYFQGYHEIGSILLLVTNEPTSFRLLERLSLNHISDCMKPSFAEVSKILNLLFPLLLLMDKDVYRFLIDSNVQPMFAISWIITWFSHNFEELEPTARLFDYFLSTHPLAPLYFSAVVDDLLKLPCAYDTVHNYFTNLPEELPLDHLIKQTQSLLVKIPPKKLQDEAKIQLDKDSPMTNYPFSWMTKGKSQLQKPTIFKLSFFLVFGTICILSLSVFIQLMKQSNSAIAYGDLTNYLKSINQPIFKHASSLYSGLRSLVKHYIGY